MSKSQPMGSLLWQLRNIMRDCKYFPKPLNAYIVPSTDAHNTEFLAEKDKRRSYISGFTGSVGIAVITAEYAGLWTDGRYYLQASQELNSNWTLMKEGEPSTPSPALWLSKNLPPNSIVGVDPNVISHSSWITIQQPLESYGHTLCAVETNLIDLLWTDKQQELTGPVIPLELKFAGKSLSQKLGDIRLQMKNNDVSILVLTALDEIAWLLNLRGSDVKYTPVFFAFVIIFPKSVVVLIDPTKITPTVQQHLQGEADLNIHIEPYNKAKEILKQSIDNVPEGFVWLSSDACYALTSIVPAKRLKSEVTPVALTKIIKNSVEIAGMRNAHVKDAVALCCYFAWLEKTTLTEKVTELSGSDKLNEFRMKQADYVGPSFVTNSSVGPHGAVIHYIPHSSTDAQITADALYLCDSGAQFKDGTTDVTRTVHFGTPTEFEKECFTRVLKGQLRIARSIFPTKIKGNCLDSFARQFLWDVGLDYAHGTGHGIGSFLNMHEGPIGMSSKIFPNDPGLEAGMFISNEPGYYEDGKFGIRIEDIVHVVAANPPHNFNNRGFLTVETVTLVPKQTKMIKVELLTPEEIAQLNTYHQRCRDTIGPILDKQELIDAKKWLWKETEPIKGCC